MKAIYHKYVNKFHLLSEVVFIPYIIVGSFLFIAMVFDLRTYKVSNKLILIGVGIGMTYQISQHQVMGILNFLVGAIVPILVLFLLCISHVLGSGDIKLFAIIGGSFGISFGMTCIWYSFVAGAILAVILLIIRKNFLSRSRYFIQYLKTCFMCKCMMPYCSRTHEAKSVFHFTIAIFTGFLCLGMKQL